MKKGNKLRGLRGVVFWVGGGRRLTHNFIEQLNMLIVSSFGIVEWYSNHEDCLLHEDVL